jgi:hypothetical protein
MDKPNKATTDASATPSFARTRGRRFMFLDMATPQYFHDPSRYEAERTAMTG